MGEDDISSIKSSMLFQMSLVIKFVLLSKQLISRPSIAKMSAAVVFPITAATAATSLTFKPNRRRIFKISSSPDETPPTDTSASGGDRPAAPADPLKLAFEKARAYKEAKKLPRAEDPAKIAMEKAKEYRKLKGAGGDVQLSDFKSDDIIGKQATEEQNLTSDVSDKGVEKKEKMKISNIDFIGLNFSEKKRTRGPPPGLVPIVDPFSDKDVIEVELIVGDSRNFEAAKQRETLKEEDDVGFYKPKVTSWGVFPRPNDISKTFGGGRTIRPGEALESVEDKAAKEARSKELIAAYKNRMGLTIDAKTKAECEKVLGEGDNLMNLGRLREALPYYEKVMDAVTFKSELHGRAALQWSIVQDSLSRPDEARAMYEKLQSHPNVLVSKKAKQFAFSFQAMEMMNVTETSSNLSPSGFQDYFEAFVEKKVQFSVGVEEKNEDAMKEALPYLILLVTPIFLIVLIAARKIM